MLFARFVSGQTRCELVKEYSLAECARDTAKSIVYLEQLLKSYPSDYYADYIKLALSEKYQWIGALDKARELALSIVNDPDPSYGTYSECPDEYNSAKCNMQLWAPPTFVELQYNASLQLFNIYNREKKFDSALYILKRADKDFSFFQRPLPSSWQKQHLLYLSSAYENIGDTQNAIQVLVPYLTTEPVIDSFIALLKKYGVIDRVRNAYRNVEDSLVIRYEVVVSENPVEIYERAENGRLLRVTSIEEYGRLVIWRFMGEEFLAAKANDYKSNRIKGEKKRRKLEPVTSDEQLMREAAEEVKSFHFYKKLYE